MAGRGKITYYRSDNKAPITDDEIYEMVMLHQYNKLSINKIAQKFSLNTTQVRIILGKRSTGGVCG